MNKSAANTQQFNPEKPLFATAAEYLSSKLKHKKILD